MSDFNIKIGAKLEDGTLSNLQKELNNLKLNVKINFGNNSSEINKYIREMEKGLTSGCQSAATQASRTFAKNFNLNTSTKAIGDFKKQLSSLHVDQSSINKAVAGLKDLGVQLTKITGTTKGNSLTKLDINGLDEYGRKIKIIQSLTKDGTYITTKSFTTNFEQANKSAEKLVTNVEEVTEKTNKLNKATTEQKIFDGLSAQQVKLSSNIDAFINKNTKLTNEYRTQLNILKEQAQSAKTNKDLTSVNKQFQAISAQAKAQNLLGRSTMDEFKNITNKFSSWIGTSTIVMGAIHSVQNGFQNILDMNSSMIELKKVSDDTNESFEEFYYTSNDLAKNLGQTTKSIIEMTAAWAQMDYTLKESQKLTEDSSKFATISPEMNPETAQEGMVSAIKAYKIDANNALDEVGSKVNTLGNEFAVTNSDMIEVIKRSGAALSDAGNDISESMALAVPAVEITRDAASVGTAIRTISLRIRGLNEETGLVDESLETIKGKLSEITGVSAYDAATGELRTTYDILKDVASIYNTLSDKSKSGVIEVIGGKRQANQVSAILNNWDTVEDAMSKLENSAGSAEREFEKAQEGIAYHLNELHETVTGVFQNLIDSDSVKATVDLLTGLVNIVDTLTGALSNLGGINIGAGVLGAFLGAKGLGWVNLYSCRQLCPDKA